MNEIYMINFPYLIAIISFYTLCQIQNRERRNKELTSEFTALREQHRKCIEQVIGVI